MKILITGGAGFIGFHLGNELVKNHQVWSIDNMLIDENLKLKKIRCTELNKKIKFEEMDINKSEDLKALIKLNKIDLVIHLAAVAGVRGNNIEQYTQSNIVGFVSICEAIKDMSIKLIYASSSSVYSEKSNLPYSEKEELKEVQNYYAMTKQLNEKIVKQYPKLNALGLRLFSVYGEYGRQDMAYFKFTKQIIEEKEIKIYGDGKNIRCLTYIDDVIKSINVLIKSNIKEKVINIGSQNQISVNDLVKLLEEKLNKKAIIKYEENNKENKVIVGDNELMKKYHINIETSINEGMNKYLKWYMQYKKYCD